MWPFKEKKYYTQEQVEVLLNKLTAKHTKDMHQLRQDTLVYKINSLQLGQRND